MIFIASSILLRSASAQFRNENTKAVIVAFEPQDAANAATVLKERCREIPMTTVYVSPLNGDDTHTGLEQDKPVRTIARAREIAVKCNAEEIRVFDGAFSSRLRVELEKEVKKKRRGAPRREGNA